MNSQLKEKKERLSNLIGKKREKLKKKADEIKKEYEELDNLLEAFKDVERLISLEEEELNRLFWEKNGKKKEKKEKKFIIKYSILWNLKK